jgi:myo-inositol-1(or 4)-monophosphatase
MNELAFINEILAEAADRARAGYMNRADVEVSSKRHRNDLLTAVDLAVQDLIVRRINDAYPGDWVAAEERDFNKMPATAPERAWVIDPIDGTQNFVRGLVPAFGVSIAFAQKGRAVAGGIMLPMMDKLFLGECGAGVTCNGRRLRVSEIKEAAIARVEVDFSGPPERAETLRRFGRVICGTGQVRCNCSTVVSLCSIAAGEMDAFMHVALNPWDYAAGQMFVEEAGGMSSRLDGGPLGIFDGGRGVLITNGSIHEEMLALVDP